MQGFCSEFDEKLFFFSALVTTVRLGAIQLPARAGSNTIKAAIQNAAHSRKFLASAALVSIRVVLVSFWRE